MAKASPKNKVVMEIMRLILETIFEPTFNEHNHRFRSSKDCHTALKLIRETFGVAAWYIRGDIIKCFDSIKHQRLMALIEFKIARVRCVARFFCYIYPKHIE